MYIYGKTHIHLSTVTDVQIEWCTGTEAESRQSRVGHPFKDDDISMKASVHNVLIHPALHENNADIQLKDNT